MEVINHIILRLNLYARGIAPLNYDRWVQLQQDMGFIIPTGFQMKFYHASLAGYYSRYPLDNNPRIRLADNKARDVRFYWLILLIAGGLLAAPFLMRYKFNFYWKSPTEIKTDFEQVSRVNDSIFRVQKTGVYKIAASGRIHVGTFVGNAPPDGILYGFMGMPMDGAYNTPGLENFQHAALLIRKRAAAQKWSAYTYVSKSQQVYLNEGDEIQFHINDKEWQNNSGRFLVRLKPCESCK
jgi:hypothetical protein